MTGRSVAAKFEQASQYPVLLRVRKPRVQALARGRALQCGMGVEAQRCVAFRLGGSAIFAIDLTVILEGGLACAPVLARYYPGQPSSSPLPSIAKHPIAGKVRAQSPNPHQPQTTSTEDYKNHVRN